MLRLPKLSPLAVFLLLLAALVALVLLSKHLPSLGFGFMQTSESFISFNQSLPAGTASLVVPSYSKTNSLMKVYDSLYLDIANTNLVQFFGKSYDGSTSDVSGTSLTFVSVIPRTGNPLGNYRVAPAKDASGASAGVPPALVGASAPVARVAWTYPSSLTMSANLPYQVLYFALDAAATVVVVYDLAAKKFVTTATTNVDGTRINIPLTGPAPPVAFIPPSSDTTLGTSVVNATYSSSQKLYNICGSVLYDPLNGYLVMVAADKSLTVYTPSGGAPLLTGIKTPNTIKPPTTRTVSNSDATWMASDAAGGNLVIYVPYMNYTCVGVMCADATNPALLAVRSAVFFDGAPTAKTAQIPAPLAIVTVTGVIDGALFAPASAVTSAPTTGVSGESLDDVIRNYYQSYWYDSANAEGARTSSDFMLKTQMIPPICPACPASCGCGKCASAIDASGAAPQTVDASGNSIYTTGPGLALTPGSNPLPGTKTETDAQKLSAAGEIKAGVTGVYGEAKDVAGDVYGEAKGVVGGVAGDVTGGVKSGVTGVYGEVKDVVGDVAGGVVGGVKGVYGEAKDVVGGVVGGVGNVVGSVAGGVGSAVGGVANGVGNVVGGVLQPPTYLQQQQQQAGGGVATYAGSGSYGGYGYPPTGAPLYVAPQVGGSSRAGAAVGGGAYPPPPTPLGAVPSSPFVPITANFSAFGK